MLLSKIAGNGEKNNIPRDYYGMSNFTGGDEGVISALRACVATVTILVR